MFPRLRQRLGSALVDRIDELVEFSTLGEYALADDLLPVPMHSEAHPDLAVATALDDRPGRDDCIMRAVAPVHGRFRDDCPARDASLSRRCDD